MANNHTNQVKRRRVSDSVYADEAFDGHYGRISTGENSAFPVLPSIGTRARVIKNNPDNHHQTTDQQTRSCIVMSGIQAGLYCGMLLVKYDDGSTGHVDPDDLQVTAAVGNAQNNRGTDPNQQRQQIPLPSQAPPGSLMAQLQELRQRKEQVTTQAISKSPTAQHLSSPSGAQSTTQAPQQQALNVSSVIHRSQSKTVSTAKPLLFGKKGAYTDFATLSHADELAKLYNHETVSCVSCGGRSTILIHTNGTCDWTPGLPAKLLELLQKKGQQREEKWIQQPSQSPKKPTYVAIGSRDRYYVQYDNGEADWNACDIMSKDLFEEKHTERTVLSVAFGSDWDSFFIVYSNGGVCFDEVPEGLIKALSSTQKSSSDSPKPKCVSLGPQGEYFMSTTDGTCWWGSLETKAAEKIQKIEREHGIITFLDFGDNGSYFLEYGSASTP